MSKIVSNANIIIKRDKIIDLVLYDYHSVYDRNLGML